MSEVVTLERHIWIVLMALVLAVGYCRAQEAKPDARVAYAPDIVGVDRMFMIAIKVAPEVGEVKVSLPDGVTMFDRTPLPAKADVRRYYFRAAKPSAQAEIKFAHPEGEVVVPVVVWSFDDLREFRTLKGVQLPRRWPLGEPLPELKQQQLFPTGAEEKTAKGSGGWLDVSDDVIWEMQPDSTIPRWHWVNLPLGCPVHGKEIYTKTAYYPWHFETSMPPWNWKVRCPIGNESYPSNDFGAGDMTSGDFPDDGIGGGYVQDGKHYGFIAEVCQYYGRRMMTVAPSCANSYAGTGDLRYMHKCLVALCRLAAEWGYLGTMTQHRHRNRVSQVNRFGQGRLDEGPCLRSSGFNVYCIELPTHQRAHAMAYDKIFPAIEKDPDIIPYLQGKGFDIKTHEDVRRFIEENLFAVWMQGSMDAACASNEPNSQWGFARMAEVLDYKRGTEFMDFLYYGHVFEFNPMIIFAPNTFFRDGAPFESMGGYNGAHIAGTGPIVEIIKRMRERHPDLYTQEKYPSLTKSRRYRSIFDFSMDTVTIDRSFPQIGDGGSFPKYGKLPKRTFQNGGYGAFEHAYKMLEDPKFAWALARDAKWQPSADFPYTREQIEQEADKWPDDWNDGSSLHDGYGITILRGGKAESKRAFWMMYGRSRGHCQDEILDFGLQGYEGLLLTHMGYPRNWGAWEPAWTSHYGARQFPYQTMTAQSEIFADAGLVHVAEARAQNLLDRVDAEKKIELPPDDWQRRTLALVDAGPDQFYCVDFYRISGGSEHWWPFHCQEGDFVTSGIELTKQEGGTLAGADVPYGDATWLKEHGCSYGGYGWRGLLFPFAHLYNVEKGTSDGVWSADWKLKTGEGLHIRLTCAGPDQAEVNICDGTSPAGGNPYEMKWIMTHRTGEAPLRTQLLNIIEPYMETPVIQQVEPLAVSGEDEAGFAAQGCTVRLADRTDTLLQAADPSVTRTAEGGFSFAGRFGFWAERNGVPTGMALVGGTMLTKGKLGIKLDSAEYRGKITKVDYDAATITVSPGPSGPDAMIGAYIYITSPQRRLAYKVVGAKPVKGGAELALNMDPRIGIGQVTGTEDLKVLTDTPFQLQRYRYYQGARLVNAESNAEYRILEVRSTSAAIIDPEAHPDATADKLAKEFANGTWFEVHDFGLGDEIVWPYTVSVQLIRDGIYEVQAPVDVKITLPDGARRR